MIGNIPSPCPTLREGLSLGAREHSGFVNVWNWIVDIFRNAKNKLVLAVNGRTGDLSIVAGTGIDVVTNGNVITIGLGKGESKDEDNPTDVNPNGGGAEDNENIWENEEPSEVSGGGTSSGGSCGMFAWDEESATMGPGGCMFGRQWVNATGTGSGKADGLYQLRCSIANTGTTTCAVVSNASLGQAPTTQYCWIPIYQITDGKIAADYRGAFVVPCYE